MSASFDRQARLKKRSEFDRTYRQGRRAGGRFFLCFFLQSGEVVMPRCRLGLSVSRKVGGAVVRNRIKRVVREFFRQRRAFLRPGLDVVVNARPVAAQAATRDLWRDLDAVFHRAGAWERAPAGLTA